MMSLPTLTWQVQGMPARQHAAARLKSRCGNFRTSMTRPTASPSPSFRSAASQITSFKPAVSCHRPNWPTGIHLATSSLVPPTKASSKSWIRPAPLVAKCVTSPRSMRSIRNRERPSLIGCAPIISTTGRLAFRAATIRATSSGNSG